MRFLLHVLFIRSQVNMRNVLRERYGAATVADIDEWLGPDYFFDIIEENFTEAQVLDHVQQAKSEALIRAQSAQEAAAERQAHASQEDARGAESGAWTYTQLNSAHAGTSAATTDYTWDVRDQPCTHQPFRAVSAFAFAQLSQLNRSQQRHSDLGIPVCWLLMSRGAFPSILPQIEREAWVADFIIPLHRHGEERPYVQVQSSPSQYRLMEWLLSGIVDSRHLRLNLSLRPLVPAAQIAFISDTHGAQGLLDRWNCREARMALSPRLATQQPALMQSI